MECLHGAEFPASSTISNIRPIIVRQCFYPTRFSWNRKRRAVHNCDTIMIFRLGGQCKLGSHTRSTFRLYRLNVLYYHMTLFRSFASLFGLGKDLSKSLFSLLKGRGNDGDRLLVVGLSLRQDSIRDSRERSGKKVMLEQSEENSTQQNDQKNKRNNNRFFRASNISFDGEYQGGDDSSRRLHLFFR